MYRLNDISIMAATMRWVLIRVQIRSPMQVGQVPSYYPSSGSRWTHIKSSATFKLIENLWKPPKRAIVVVMWKNVDDAAQRWVRIEKISIFGGRALSRRCSTRNDGIRMIFFAESTKFRCVSFCDPISSIDFHAVSSYGGSVRVPLKQVNKKRFWSFRWWPSCWWHKYVIFMS